MEAAIRELEAQTTLVVRGTCDLAGISDFIHEAFGRVFGLIERRGLVPVGMPFVRYLEMPGAEFRVEAGCAVAAPDPGEGEVVPGDLPAGPCAVAWHIGPFDTIADTYMALQRWIVEQGRAPGGPPWECYWSDPAQEPDPARWRTEVFQPLAI